MILDYDAIIVGGGPAGLTAATELAREKRRVLLLDRESFGGQVMNCEWIEDYPRPGERLEGPLLGSELVSAAQQSGVVMELGEVVELESYSGCRSVACADGKTYTAPVVIVAGGLSPKKLGVPGEEAFQGKGMIHCAACDAGLYAGETVAVCGGGDAGTIEALYLAKFASRVVLIEVQDRLTAAAALEQRARGNAKLDIRCGQKIVEVAGKELVTAVVVQDVATGSKDKIDVHGVLVRTGFEPASAYLGSVLALDAGGYVKVKDPSETGVPGVFAAGDIRSGSPRGVAAAVSDGKVAAANARRFLESLR